MRRLVLIGVAIAIVLSAGISCSPNTEKEKVTVTVAEKEKAAFTAAKKWLTLVDEGNYLESWGEATEYFRSTVERDKQWGEFLRSRRTGFGEVISRILKTHIYKMSLPNVPDGQYVVIKFETSFFQKKNIIETVMLMLDKDGRWRVISYNLQ
jgi:hypothetical protein